MRTGQRATLHLSLNVTTDYVYTVYARGAADGSKQQQQQQQEEEGQPSSETDSIRPAYGTGGMRFSLGTCRRWENWGRDSRARADMDRVDMSERGARPRREGTMREEGPWGRGQGQGQGTGARARAAAAEGSVGRGRVRGQGVSVGGRESVLQAAGMETRKGRKAWHSKPNVVLAQRGWWYVCVCGGLLCRGRGRRAVHWATAGRAVLCALS